MSVPCRLQAVAKRKSLVVLAALVLATVIGVMLVRPTRRGSGTTAGTHSSETTVSRGAAPPGSSMTATAADARGLRPPVSEHRAAMLAAIAKAREASGRHSTAPARTPGTPGAATTTGSDTPGTTLDLQDKTGDTSEWSKRALGTINQMLGQCLDLGLAEDAKLEGTVKVRFRLVGEPGVGGVLESVEIVDADTTITQQTIRDCLAQQLYALELDPPPDGVTVEREVSLKVP